MVPCVGLDVGVIPSRMAQEKLEQALLAVLLAMAANFSQSCELSCCDWSVLARTQHKVHIHLNQT